MFYLTKEAPWEIVKINFSLTFLRVFWQRPQKGILSTEMFSPDSLIYRVNRMCELCGEYEIFIFADGVFLFYMINLELFIQ